MRQSCSIVSIALLLAGCADQGPRTVVEPLSPNSRRIAMDGFSAAQVTEKWGEPQVVLRNNYIALTVGQPATLPPFDEQWSYATEQGHRLVYFMEGKVVLVVEEWADA